MYDLFISLLKIGVIVLLFLFRHFIMCLPELLYWWMKDLLNYDKELFRSYGVWMFCGKQGSGKSMSLIYHLEKLRRRYPKCKIYTNMGYIFENAPLKSLKDLLNTDFYNGKYGTIFVIDEIQNEFSCQTSKDFPESLLSLITQQRKNRVLILTTSQVFSRVSKPIREQCYRAIECSTFLGRYTRNKHFNGIDYSDSFDLSPEKRKKACKKLYIECFVQTDYLRNCFDSYKLIERLDRNGFVPKISDNYNNVNITNVTSNNSKIRKR